MEPSDSDEPGGSPKEPATKRPRSRACDERMDDESGATQSVFECGRRPQRAALASWAWWARSDSAAAAPCSHRRLTAAAALRRSLPTLAGSPLEALLAAAHSGGGGGDDDAKDWVLTSEHLMTAVFSHLSLEDLCRAAMVRTRWREVTSNPEFWRTINLKGRTVQVAKVRPQEAAVGAGRLGDELGGSQSSSRRPAAVGALHGSARGVALPQHSLPGLLPLLPFRCATC